MNEKQVARRFLVEVLAGGRLDLLDEILGDGYVDNDMPAANPEGKGKAGVRWFIGAYHVAFSDLQCGIEDQILEGDRVATRCRLTGVNTGPFFGMPATGRRINLPAITVYRIAAGKIAEAWVQYDNALLQQQLRGGVVAASSDVYRL